MSNGRYAKPRREGRGFARSIWQPVAPFNYIVALARASDCIAILPVAVDGACGVFALLWGGVR